VDPHAELTRFNPSPELADWVLGRLQQVIDEASAEATRRDQELSAAKTRIQTLTLELAHLRRMRYDARSEALSAEQRELFDETLGADVTAAEAELGAATVATPPPRVPRERAGRQRLPQHLPRIGHRHEPESCTCGLRFAAGQHDRRDTLLVCKRC
jgi:transposase